MTQKAKNLALLASAGVIVPKGFVVSGDHYHRATRALKGTIAQAMRNPQHIDQLFMGLELPEETRAFVQAQLALLPSAATFAVRSSGAIGQVGEVNAVLEDSAASSLAGQFDSFLNVPRAMVEEAIKSCWASLFNPRSVAAFCAHPSYVLSSEMTVVVQEMIPAKASAVMMTADPLGDGSTGAVEFAWGPCGAIVGGITSPDSAVFDRETGRLLSILVGRKECRIEYTAYRGSGTNELRVGTSKMEQAAISLEFGTLIQLIELGGRIERLFGCPQDIEAVVTHENNIVVTQTRPVTMLDGGFVPFNISTAA